MEQTTSPDHFNASFYLTSLTSHATTVFKYKYLDWEFAMGMVVEDLFHLTIKRWLGKSNTHLQSEYGLFTYQTKTTATNNVLQFEI